MTTQNPPTFHRRLGALVVFVALFATSCGSSTAITQTTAERAVEAPAQPAAPDAAPADDTAPPATAAETAESAAPPANDDSSAPAQAGGHQYGTSIDDFVDTSASSSIERDADATTIAWDDLIPEGARAQDVFDRFEARLEEVEIGSPEATALYQEMQAEFDPAAVNSSLDGQKIWLAGFVAPLTYDDEIVTEFLLVPSFGACIHVPPPPPNQTILVSVDKEYGLSFEDSWGAIWVQGTLTLDYATTDLAEASYTITSATSGVYNGV